MSDIVVQNIPKNASSLQRSKKADGVGIELQSHPQLSSIQVPKKKPTTGVLPAVPETSLSEKSNDKTRLGKITKTLVQAGQFLIDANKPTAVLASKTLVISHFIDLAREATILSDFENPQVLNRHLPALFSILALGHLAVIAAQHLSKGSVQNDQHCEAHQEKNLEQMDVNDKTLDVLEAPLENKVLAGEEQARIGGDSQSVGARPNNYLVNTIRQLVKATAVMSRITSYYSNPVKQVLIDANMLGAQKIAQKIPKPFKHLRHLSFLGIIMTNAASFSTFRYLGSLSDMAKQSSKMQGAGLGHPLAPIGNSSGLSFLYRDIPHNAGAAKYYAKNFFSQYASAMLANQKGSITSQLERGARALMIDIKKDHDGSIRSNHEILDYGPLSEPLSEIYNFLNKKENLNERVLLLIENTNSVDIRELTKLFNDTGLYDLLPKGFGAWRPSQLNDSRYADARVFPVVGRTWNSTTFDPGFARALSVVGNDTAEYSHVVAKASGFSTSPLVAVFQSLWSHKIPDVTDCPLSCAPITDIACIEVANHFGWPVPEIHQNMLQHIQEHAKNCLNGDPKQNLYLASDHTQKL